VGLLFSVKNLKFFIFYAAYYFFFHLLFFEFTCAYTGGRQQLSFQSRPAISSTWENSSNSTYSIAKMKTKKSRILDGISQLPDAVNVPTIAFNRPVPSKGTSVEVLDQGLLSFLFDYYLMTGEL
jgi:hypothetical protein